MKYRPEIDGLRAIAVVPVILFHAGFSAFSGGFVGVDVFFVISGYLITNIIYSEISAGEFSILRFYERRARRILPALFLVCLVCIPFAYLWMLPRELKNFSESLLTVISFVSNILFWHESGYFAAASELKPLLHTWSLAIEEQFYIFFPLLLLLLRNMPRRSLIILIGAISLGSLAIAEYTSRFHSAANFYLLPSRAWELGGGVLLSLAIGGGRVESSVIRQVGSLVGLGLIGVAIFTFDETIRFPSVWALIPVTGSMLIIACSGGGDLVGRVLAWKPIVGIGLISYSAYLWHQPLFAFARLKSLEDPSTEFYLILTAATFLLALITWQFVESPFRDRNLMSIHKMSVWISPVMVLIIAFGALGQTENTLTRLHGNTFSVEHGRMPGCKHDQFSAALTDQNCSIRENKGAEIVLWGDSHAAVFSSSIYKFADKNGFNFVQFARGGCFPTTHVKRTDMKTSCPDENKVVVDYASTNMIYIVSARYALSLTGNRFDNGRGGIERGRPVRFECYTDFCDDKIEMNYNLMNSFNSDISDIVDSGATIIIVGQIPEAGFDVPSQVRRFGINKVTSTSISVQNKRNKKTYEMMQKLEKHDRVFAINPIDVFCGKTKLGECDVALNGKILYRDDDHLSLEGVNLLMPFLEEKLMQIAGTDTDRSYTVD